MRGHGPSIGGDRHIRRLCHERDFGRRLDHPATAHDRIGGDHAKARRQTRKPVAGEEADRFLDPDLALRDAARPERIRDQRDRAFILLPHADFRRDGQRLAHRRFFEEGRDDHRIALREQDGRGQPLAAPPFHSGEIDEGRARFDQDRVDALIPHQPAGAFDPRLALGDRDRQDIARDPRQARHVRRGERRCSKQRGQGERAAPGKQAAAGNGSAVHHPAIIVRNPIRHNPAGTGKCRAVAMI